MNIFKMSMEEFDKWIESEEGKIFIEEGAKKILEMMENNPAYYSSECWAFNCKYNSEHTTEFTEMGIIPYCTKFNKGEKNTCPYAEEGSWNEDEY